MAMIDYGALVIKNGKPVNKNGGLFMDPPHYMDDIVKGNYYVYCGDEELSFCFYKCNISVVKNGHIINNFWQHPFKSETHYVGDTNITVTRLDDLIPEYPEHLMSCATWGDYVRETWEGATGKEKDYELENGRKWHKLWIKRCKEIGRKKPLYYTSTLKYSATWEYKGDQWEVIFGYGIDPDEEVFEEITNSGLYNYGEKSIKYIKEKFFDK